MIAATAINTRPPLVVSGDTNYCRDGKAIV
jgi:hypothetical protein